MLHRMKNVPLSEHSVLRQLCTGKDQERKGSEHRRAFSHTAAVALKGQCRGDGDNRLFKTACCISLTEPGRLVDLPLIVNFFYFFVFKHSLYCNLCLPFDIMNNPRFFSALDIVKGNSRVALTGVNKYCSAQNVLILQNGARNVCVFEK